MNQLLQAPAWLLAILSIVLWCLLAGGLGVAGRRFLPAKADDRYSDVQRMLLSVGGIFCGVVVALSVFVVWDHHSGARQAEIDQGAALVALYQDGETLPQPARAQVAAAIRGYTTSMIREEFPALAGGGSSDDTERSLTRMSVTVHEFLANTSAPDRVSDVARAQYLLMLAGDAGLPPILWLLLLGACVLLLLVVSPAFMESRRHSILSSVVLGCIFGAATFLIVAADHPFAGPLQVRPTDLAQNLRAYSVMDSGVASRPSPTPAGGAPAPR
ncbi:MAG: DUF4239 domain-containing protein [Chloroflexi bacterium]|nr:MAG: DUF4239 domain-containing protein [Chloroflexota bacterium]